MKKLTLICNAALTSLALAGCAGGGGSSKATSETSTGEASSEISYSYGEKEMYQKYWEGNVMYNETVMLVEGDDGVIKGRLLYTPTRIISVRDSTLDKEFDSSNYRIEGDYIIRTESSKLPYLTKGNVATTDLTGISDLSTYAAKEGNILFTEGTGIVTRQIAVTYEHADSWQGSIPACQGSKLPSLQTKLKNKSPIKMVVNGDSIFTGCNASSKLAIRPFQDTFPDGFKAEIESTYGSSVTLVNTAVGGQVSSWGKLNVVNNVNQYDPDLVIIGFGMNDGCEAFQVKAADYVENIETMIKSIQYNCTDPEIIVCSTIIANPESTQNCLQETYLEPLKEMIANYEGVALMDMTTFSKDLFKKKKSLDMLANNINHPSDFLVRGYVMNLMTTIEEK